MNIVESLNYIREQAKAGKRAWNEYPLWDARKREGWRQMFAARRLARRFGYKLQALGVDL